MNAENAILHKAVVSGSILGPKHGAVLWASPLLEAYLQSGNLSPCEMWSNDEAPALGIWVWEGEMSLQEGAVLRGSWRLPNLTEWDCIHKGHNPCLSPGNPTETALDAMLTVAATLLQMEDDDFIQEFANPDLPEEDLLAARDALSTLCYTNVPNQVCIAWLPPYNEQHTGKLAQ